MLLNKSYRVIPAAYDSVEKLVAWTMFVSRVINISRPLSIMKSSIKFPG